MSRTDEVLVAPFVARGIEPPAFRSLGFGVSAVVRDLISSGGLPLRAIGLRGQALDDPAGFFLSSPNPQADVRVLCGEFDPQRLVPMRLQLVDWGQGRLLDSRDFTVDDQSHWLEQAMDWLAKAGSGSAQPASPVPEPDSQEALAVAHQAGLEWLLLEREDGGGGELGVALDEMKDFFSSRLEEAAAARILRPLLLWLAQELAQRRQQAQSEQGLDVLAQLSGGLDPFGLDRVWPLLNAGVERGFDETAFRACRGYVHVALGRPLSALEDFRSLRDRHPLQGWFALARAHEALQDWDQALQAFSQALAICRPQDVYSEAVEGVQEEVPDPQGRTWQGALHFARGRALWVCGRFPQAVRDLDEAIHDPALTWLAKEILSYACRDWGKHILAIDPEQARQHLSRHLGILEELFQRHPRSRDIRTAMESSQLIGDAQLRRKWGARWSRLPPAESIPENTR